MTQDEYYRGLLTRLATALAITEAANVEAKRRRNLWALNDRLAKAKPVH